jgi:hypothetical protein
MAIFDILGNLESVGILHLLSNSCDEYFLGLKKLIRIDYSWYKLLRQRND